MTRMLLALIVMAVFAVSSAPDDAHGRILKRHCYGYEPTYYYGHGSHLEYFSPHYGYYHHNSHIPYSRPVPGLSNNSGAWWR